MTTATAKQRVIQSLRFEQITIDPEVHARAEINSSWADHLAKKHTEVCELDPPIVFQEDRTYILASGFHQIEGRRRKHPRGRIDCDIRQGSRNDAIFFASGCNIRDQLPRTDEDQERAVSNLIRLIETAPDLELLGGPGKKEKRPLGIWPNTWIALHCGVSEHFVRNVKRWLKEESEEDTFAPGESSTNEVDENEGEEDARNQQSAAAPVPYHPPLDAEDVANLREQLDRLSRKNARKYAELGLLPTPLLRPTDEQTRRLQQAWSHLRAIPAALGELASENLREVLAVVEERLAELLPEEPATLS